MNQNSNNNSNLKINNNLSNISTFGPSIERQSDDIIIDNVIDSDIRKFIDNNNKNISNPNLNLNSNHSISENIHIDPECISYDQSMLELFLPSPIIFKTFCVSTDKTRLFLVSFIRIIFYLIIYYVINDIIDFEQYRYIKYPLLTIIVSNIFYLGFVVGKTTLYSMGSNISMISTTVGNNRLLYY